MASASNGSPVESEDNYKLQAKIDNVKNIYFLLKAINFQDKATVFVTENGLKVTVEDSKCVQASAFIQNDIFQEYRLDELEVPLSFSLHLNVLLECLNIFGISSSGGSTSNISTALKLCYRGYGYPVQLLLEEEGVITDCSIKTIENEELMNIEFNPDTVLNKIIIQTEILKEVFSSLDAATDLLEIFISDQSPYFRITSISNVGECQIEIPKDSDAIESFQCAVESKSRFKYAHIKPALKSLNVSHKVSIRTNDNNIICFQFMAKTEDGHVCFIEYYCLPLVDDD